MTSNYLAISCQKNDVIYEKAKGAKIWLDGKPYLDFACGPGVANVGWNHPEIIKTAERLIKQNKSGWGGNMLVNEYQMRLSEKLSRITPGNFSKKVFFSNSGGEAVEAAIIACLKRRPERHGFVSFIGDFHGRLGFCRAATTSRSMHFEKMPLALNRAFFLIFPAENPETPSKKEFMNITNTPDRYLTYVENQIGPFIKDINFALFELVQGEGGINVAKKELIRALFKYLKENQVWIIVDEVQSGLGRTGAMWASDIYEVEPDIITTAKALSGGIIPLGATIIREELSFQKYSEHCNTFGGGAFACAVGLKVIEIIEKQNLVKQAQLKGEEIRKRLQLLCDISGCGLMNRISFSSSEIRNQIRIEAFKRGLYLTEAGENSLRLMPPLTINDKEIDRAIEILVKTIYFVQSTQSV